MTNKTLHQTKQLEVLKGNFALKTACVSGLFMLFVPMINQLGETDATTNKATINASGMFTNSSVVGTQNITNEYKLVTTPSVESASETTTRMQTIPMEVNVPIMVVTDTVRVRRTVLLPLDDTLRMRSLGKYVKKGDTLIRVQDDNNSLN